MERSPTSVEEASRGAKSTAAHACGLESARGGAGAPATYRQSGGPGRSLREGDGIAAGNRSRGGSVQQRGSGTKGPACQHRASIGGYISLKAGRAAASKDSSSKPDPAASKSEAASAICSKTPPARRDGQANARRGAGADPIMRLLYRLDNWCAHAPPSRGMVLEEPPSVKPPAVLHTHVSPVGGTPAGVLLAAARRTQADALEIEAGAKRRLADKYDAARAERDQNTGQQPSFFQTRRSGCHRHRPHPQRHPRSPPHSGCRSRRARSQTDPAASRRN